MANINQINVPQSLTMMNFKAAADSAGQFAKSCRFVVRIKSTNGNPQSILDEQVGLAQLIPNDLHMMCESAEFPGRGFNVTETRYYGPSQSFPNNTMYGSGINMQFICRNNSDERMFFDEWMDLINPTTTFNFAYPEDYWSDIDIYQLSEIARPGTPQNAPPKQLAQYGWTLRKAWPTLVNPQQVTWADGSDILRLQVTFTYKYWDRPTVSR